MVSLGELEATYDPRMKSIRGISAVGAILITSLVAITASDARADNGTVVLPEPLRIMDTRFTQGSTVDGVYQGGGALAGGSVLEVPVAGRAGVPTSPMPTAVFVNVQAIRPQGSGFVTVFACNTPRPASSNVNYVAGVASSNAAVIALDTSGNICIFVLTATDLAIDVFAYSSSVTPLNPERLYESRQMFNQGIQGGQGPVLASSVTEITVTGLAGVPSDAKSIFLNLVAVEAVVAGSFTIFPCGTAQPSTPSAFYPRIFPGSTLASSVIGIDGKVCIATTATTEIIADVYAYSMDPSAAPPLPTPLPGTGPNPVPDPGPPVTPVLIPLRPGRFWDTRPATLTFDDLYNSTGRLGAGGIFEIPLVGRGSIVPDGANGAAVNLTVISPSEAGFATVYPCSAEVPMVSTVNYAPGAVSANSVIVPLSERGSICVFTLAAADFALDVSGFVDPESPQVGVQPARFLETRQTSDTDTFDDLAEGSGALPPGDTLEVQIAGRGEIPTDAQAVMVNVTVVDPAAPGFVTVYPCGGEVPNTSTVNYFPGEVVPNGAVVALSEGGELCVFSLAETDVLIDVNGFIPADVDGIVTFEPGRLFDSRAGQLLVDGVATGPRLVAGGVTKVQVAGRHSIPASAVAGFFNVAVVYPDGPGFLTVYPCNDISDPIPKTSNVNHATGGVVRANNTTTMLSDDGSVCIYSLAATDVILDITGYVR